jgi:hypothetical protein
MAVIVGDVQEEVQDDAEPRAVAEAWGGLAPRFDWRPSQRHLLELAAGVADHRWHLCAPPGAGKTLIGLELARRVGRPTLVLAPTTAIRDQWRQAVAMFGADPRSFTSDEVSVAAPLRAVTYQLLGNPGDAAAELEAAARRLWLAEVGRQSDPEAAERRVAATESRDPTRARRELRRHVRVLRRSLATGDDIGVPRRSLLGERTAALIDQLAGAGIGCVVLDECHHLLDWWALVVGALVERLDADCPVAIVGLTATLPDPDSSREAENYRGLLGEVDAELQLAAMVAEGAVAPWRDGVRVAGLTAPEQDFLDDWTGRLCADLDEELTSDPFLAWAVAQIADPALEARVLAGTAGTVEGWDRFWDRDPLTAAAVARWWAARGMSLPAGFDPPEDVHGPFGVTDRLRLVDAWLHDPLAPTAADSAELTPAGGPNEVREVGDRVGRVLRRYGLALTTSGVRWGRSAADLVCARSSAKGPAAADVLAGEARRRGDRLRALVVVERDRATTPPAAARAVLGEDAGTVARVLAALCARGEVAELGVVAVTGRGAWADALGAERIAAAMNVACAGTGGWVRVEGCDIAGAVRLAGQGGGWTSARWLAAAEAAMDDGGARVLVATRGLVGEGWDHPALNVLVDLSEVASSTATTQLRGRAIRLDPADPHKLASLWDVVVAHPEAPGDWDRLRRRHRHWWGPDLAGAVATGPAKLHPRAGLPEPPSPADAPRINAESAAAVADDAATRAAWDALDPGGVASPGLHVRSHRRRRVRTRSRGWRWAAAGSAGAGLASVVLAVVAASQPVLWTLVAAGVAAAALLGTAVRGRRRDQAETLAALGEAVLAGLIAAGTHHPPAPHARNGNRNEDRAQAQRLGGGRVVVERDPAGGWVALLDGAPDDAAERWADALAEALGPLGTPRWMVAVGTDQAWRVPAGVGTTRAAAEAFARRFRSRVPSARLVRAGTPDATRLVLAASRQAPDELDRSLRWRSPLRPGSGRA